MRKVLGAISILALAACSAQNDEAGSEDAVEPGVELDGETPGFEAVAPGNYEVMQEDGSTDQLTIHPGMTWSMVFANGDAAGGTIYLQAGETCFVTEGVEGSDCFTTGEVSEDGTMTNTSSEGTPFTVRPVEDFETGAADG